VRPCHDLCSHGVILECIGCIYAVVTGLSLPNTHKYNSKDTAAMTSEYHGRPHFTRMSPITVCDFEFCCHNVQMLYIVIYKFNFIDGKSYSHAVFIPDLCLYVFRSHHHKKIYLALGGKVLFRRMIFL
jgi:hypothetical protein